MQEARTADICTRFSLLIKALVHDRNEVSVISGVSAKGVPTVRVWVAERDRKRLFDRGAEVAHSLRVLLDNIGEQQGVHYVLEVEGVCFEHRRLGLAVEKTGSADVVGWAISGTLPAF